VLSSAVWPLPSLLAVLVPWIAPLAIMPPRWMRMMRMVWIMPPLLMRMLLMLPLLAIALPVILPVFMPSPWLMPLLMRMVTKVSARAPNSGKSVSPHP
jgi:hypothetical protein